MSEPASITCPACGLTSFNPVDIREGYCGACHDWTSGVGPVLELEHAALIAEAELDKVEEAINQRWPQDDDHLGPYERPGYLNAVSEEDICPDCGDPIQWDSEKLACSCTIWDIN